MSTVVFWAAFDQNKFSSAYVASESRFTMQKSRGSYIYWDHGKKIFVVDDKYIFAYCGDVLYPITVLSKLKEFIENKIIMFDSKTFEEKVKEVEEFILPSYLNYQVSSSFTILFIDVIDQNINFADLKFENKKSVITFHEVNEPKEYVLEMETLKGPKVFSFGSGSEGFNNIELEFNKKGNIYSRDKFKSLYELVIRKLDHFSSGPLQLARVYRNGEAKPIGFIDSNKKFLYGDEVKSTVFNEKFEWRNKNFEICDPNTLKLKDGAQAQP